MTLIIALQEDNNSLLVAADGLEQSSNQVFSKTKHPKLHKLNNTLVFASSGNATIAEWLSKHLKDCPPNSWCDVQDTKGIPRKVAKLNGDQREVTKIAGAQWKDDFGVTCMIAGWLQGSFGIWEIDTNGQPTPYVEQGFCALGGPARFAEYIYAALSDVPMLPLEKLHRIFNSLIVGQRGIGHPLDIWRITTNGITVVEGRDEHDKKVEG